MEFSDSWLWLIFVGVGLGFIILELIVGIDTGLDMAFMGSTLVVGGLVTWPFASWWLTVVVTSIICIAYVVLGRRYVHRWTQVRKAKTNVDALIGRQGIVLQDIARNFDGRVRVGNEKWRARAAEDIRQGEEIVVTDISGATLIVEKIEGGN